jgi:heme/copper-type cytochrome/quinol oxidase subunit 2
MNIEAFISAISTAIVKSIRFGLSFGALALPVIVSAQVVPPGQIPGDVLTIVLNIAILIFSVLWVVAATFVVVMFVIAGFKYLTAQGDASKVSDANKAVIWGAAGVVVILLAWSITGVLRTQLGV